MFINIILVVVVGVTPCLPACLVSVRLVPHLIYIHTDTETYDIIIIILKLIEV